MIRAETVMLQCAKKIFEVLPKKVHCFSSFLRQFCQLVHQIVKFCPLRDHSALGQNKLFSLWKSTNQCLGCLRMEDDGVLSHQTFRVKDFPFHQPLRKQDDRCASFQVG